MNSRLFNCIPVSHAVITSFVTQHQDDDDFISHVTCAIRDCVFLCSGTQL